MHYMKKILKAVALGVIDQEAINHAVIQHDDTCNSHDDKECDCDSVVVLKTNNRWVEITDDGLIVPIE